MAPLPPLVPGRRYTLIVRSNGGDILHEHMTYEGSSNATPRRGVPRTVHDLRVRFRRGALVLRLPTVEIIDVVSEPDRPALQTHRRMVVTPAAIRASAGHG